MSAGRGRQAALPWRRQSCRGDGSIVVSKVKVQRIDGRRGTATVPPGWGRVATGIPRTPGPAGGGGRSSGVTIVQWRGGGAGSALPVVQRTVEVVAGLWGSGAGLSERVTERWWIRKLLGLA